MFQSVTVTNFLNESLELPLKWPNDAGLLISNIDGITPGNVQINSQDYAMLDGGVFNSARMKTRNIVIEMYYGFSPEIESARHRAYHYFPVKSEVRLDFLTDERRLAIWGNVESNETDIFSEHEKGQISIVCSDPYFYESDTQIIELGDSTKEFEFPFSNESLTDPKICFGDYGVRNAYQIDYQGDMTVGMIIRIRFLKAQTIPKLTLFDVTHNQSLEVNFETIKEKSSVSVIGANAEIVISSVRGDKDIYWERYGKRTSIISAFEIQGFPWMYLTPGINMFGFDADEKYLDEFVITVEYRGAYGGV